MILFRYDSDDRTGRLVEDFCSYQVLSVGFSQRLAEQSFCAVGIDRVTNNLTPKFGLNHDLRWSGRPCPPGSLRRCCSAARTEREEAKRYHSHESARRCEPAFLAIYIFHFRPPADGGCVYQMSTSFALCG